MKKQKKQLDYIMRGGLNRKNHQRVFMKSIFLPITLKIDLLKSQTNEFHEILLQSSNNLENCYQTVLFENFSY